MYPMVFSDDSFGFAFSCEDAKMSICVGSWGRRLSHIGRTAGVVLILTGSLPDPDYISQMLGKRPKDIFIVANVEAQREARMLKHRFPDIRVATHANSNAKVVLVAPDTVWISSADFGKTTQIESVVGLHSSSLFERTRQTLFNKVWAGASEIV